MICWENTKLGRKETDMLLNLYFKTIHILDENSKNIN